MLRTMTTPIFLLACFALTYAVQANKVWFITDILTEATPKPISRFFQAMFACALCTGFHCGWILYLLSLPYFSSPWGLAGLGVIHGLAGGGVSLILTQIDSKYL